MAARGDNIGAIDECMAEAKDLYRMIVNTLDGYEDPPGKPAYTSEDVAKFLEYAMKATLDVKNWLEKAKDRLR